MNTLAVSLCLACSVMRAITSFMKIPKESLVSLFPLHHDISNNFLEKFSDTKHVYASCVRVCVSSLFHLKVTYTRTYKYTYKTKHNENTLRRLVTGLQRVRPRSKHTPIQAELVTEDALRQFPSTSFSRHSFHQCAIYIHQS